MLIMSREAGEGKLDLGGVYEERSKRVAINKDLALDRGAWKLAIHVPEP